MILTKQPSFSSHKSDYNFGRNLSKVIIGTPKYSKPYHLGNLSPIIKLGHLIPPHKVFIQYNRHQGHTSLGDTIRRLSLEDSFFSFNINVR